MNADPCWRAPYPGLRSFRRDETDLFFGREDCISTMVDRLAAGRFLAVLGSSGTGKSSLVKTGLLDALELGLMGEAGSNWHVVDFKPAGTPLKSLARRLLEKQHPEGLGEQATTDADVLRAFLARGPRSIVEWCRAGHLPEGANLLLLVDQFEELFLYQDYAGREEAEAFVELLIQSARTREFPVYVAITMRSEYLGACALIEDLAEIINHGIYLTPRMTREQCYDAIVGPAAVCDVTIEPALVNRMLNDLVNFAPWDESDVGDQLDRIVRRADQLPLLQYTLHRLWLVARQSTKEQTLTLTLATYEAIGGLRGALNAHAEQIFQQLDKEGLPVEAVFRSLTAGSSISDAVRRPTQFGDLVAVCGGDKAAVRKVIDAFRVNGCNFLTPELDPEKPKPVGTETYIDISHESLIRQWKRLSEWLEKEARAAQQWRRLLDRYATGVPLQRRELAQFSSWREETKPTAAWAKRYGGDFPGAIAFLNESQRAARNRRLLGTAAAAAIFAVVAAQAIFATYVLQTRRAEWQRAEDNAAKAVANAGQAETERTRAKNSYDLAKKFIHDVIFDLADTMRLAVDKDAQRLASNRSASLGASEEDPQVEAIRMMIRSGREIIDQLAALNPNDPELAQLQAVLLSNFGEAYRSAHAVKLARQTQEEAIAKFEALTTGTAVPVPPLEGMANALKRLAALVEASKDEALALRLYRRELTINRELSEREPENPARHQRMLATLRLMVELQRRARDVEGELLCQSEMLEVDDKLAERDPNNVAWQEALSGDLDRIATLQRTKGDKAAAIKTLVRAVGIDRKLTVSERDNQRRYDDLARRLERISNLQLEIDDVAAARMSNGDRLAVLETLLEIVRRTDSSPNKRGLVSELSRTSWAAILASRPDRATQLAEEAHRHNASQPWIRVIRAHAHLLRGELEDAKKLYLAANAGSEDNSEKTDSRDLKDDFDQMRRLQIATAALARVEEELGKQ